MQPSLGGPNTSYLEQHDWLMTVSYRHYHAFRDYQGGDALPVPSPPEIYAQTRVNLFDVTMTYALTNRFSMSLELPFELGSRETYLEHEGPSPHTMTSRGVGDTRLIGNLWLLDPERHPEKNVAVAIGVKSPAGQRAAKDYSFRETGAVLRPVDPAIQPASGGWGIVFGTQGFKRLFKDTYVYFDGAYLSNPKEMNGTNAPFGDRPEITGGDIGYIIDSVPDQYVARVGLSRPILPRKAVSASFGVRTDGVPARDLIGGSDGYRLAGYTVSVEPGVSITRGKHSLALTVPWTVKGHGSKTVADKRTNSPFAGIVTLADSQLILTYSRRF